MFGLQVLDIGLGLIFLYLILSLTCTAATEMLAGVFRLRAATLEEGIGNLVRDPVMREKIFNHPLVRDLYQEGKRPSYIPPRTFALALFNILSDADGLSGLEDLRANIKKLPENSALRTSLLVLMDEAGNDISSFQKNVESWFNDTMDRVSEWYKSKAQVITVVIALIIAILGNADTIQWTKSLSSDPALREALVAQAQEYAKRDNGATIVLKSDAERSPHMGASDSLHKIPGALDSVTTAGKRIQQNLDELRKVGISLGWETLPTGLAWISKILGLLLTTLAMTLGAPFWFDLLKRAVNIRSSLAPASDTEEKDKS